MSIFGTTAFAQVISNIQTTIESVDKDIAKAYSKEAKIGMSGVIIHTFNNSQEAIIGKATVKEKSTSGELTLKVIPYKPTAQRSLPFGRKSAVAGDKVILGYAYNRAMIISQDDQTFQKIKNRHNREWIHPDIFATQLSSKAEATPTKESFNLFCQVHTVGLLYIHLNDTLYTVDCSNFNVLESLAFDKSDGDDMKPFYNRIGEIHSSMLGWLNIGSQEIADYKSHYTSLLGLK